MEPIYNRQQTLTTEGFNAFLAKVFLWMFVGLLVTAVTSMAVLATPAILSLIASNTFLYMGLMIGEIALVVVLSRNALKYDFGKTLGMFLLYSFLNGITMSIILLMYTGTAVTSAFFITASIFAVMAAYGYFTKADLSPFRTFFLVAIVGIIIATVVNIFLASGTLAYIINIAGVLIFAGLTSYDIQKMKSYYAYSVQQGGAIEGNIAVTGALTLYLDFINMFLFVLRLFGGRR